jgi:hypothetical protein
LEESRTVLVEGEEDVGLAERWAGVIENRAEELKRKKEEIGSE